MLYKNDKLLQKIMSREGEDKPQSERKYLQKTHLIKRSYLKHTKNSLLVITKRQPDFKNGQRT